MIKALLAVLVLAGAFVPTDHAQTAAAHPSAAAAVRGLLIVDRPDPGVRVVVAAPAAAAVVEAPTVSAPTIQKPAPARSAAPVAPRAPAAQTCPLDSYLLDGQTTCHAGPPTPALVPPNGTISGTYFGTRNGVTGAFRFTGGGTWVNGVWKPYLLS